MKKVTAEDLETATETVSPEMEALEWNEERRHGSNQDVKSLDTGDENLDDRNTVERDVDLEKEGSVDSLIDDQSNAKNEAVSEGLKSTKPVEKTDDAEDNSANVSLDAKVTEEFCDEKEIISEIKNALAHTDTDPGEKGTELAVHESENILAKKPVLLGENPDKLDQTFGDPAVEADVSEIKDPSVQSVVHQEDKVREQTTENGSDSEIGREEDRQQTGTEVEGNVCGVYEAPVGSVVSCEEKREEFSEKSGIEAKGKETGQKESEERGSVVQSDGCRAQDLREHEAVRKCEPSTANLVSNDERSEGLVNGKNVDEMKEKVDQARALETLDGTITMKNADVKEGPGGISDLDGSEELLLSRTPVKTNENASGNTNKVEDLFEKTLDTSADDHFSGEDVERQLIVMGDEKEA